MQADPRHRKDYFKQKGGVSHITKREQLWENYEDALFVLMMERVAEQEGECLLEENERLKLDPAAQVPNRVDQRCIRAIKRTIAKEQRQIVGRFTYRVLKSVALAAMICIMLFATALAAVPELRTKTLNLLIEISDMATSLRLTPGNDSSGTQNGGTETQTLWGYRLPELPEGFILEKQMDSAQAAMLWYSNNAGATIIFEIYKADDSNLNIDTENAESIETIFIHGYQGLLVEKESRIDIIWGDTDIGNFVSVCCTGLDRKTVWDFANSIEYCN